MVNIDKEKINNSINEAYKNQTEKVKELLESAKKNLADQKECLYDYTTNKEKVEQIYKVNRIVTKKKQYENKAEDRINSKFNEMNEKLDINSKNLDFIFENVSENDKNKISILNQISQKQDKNRQDVIQTIKEVKTQSKKNNKLTIEVKDTMQKHIQEAKVETVKEIIIGQENLKDSLVKSQLETEKRMLDAQLKAEKKMLDAQLKSKNELLDSQMKAIENIVKKVKKQKAKYCKGKV